MTCVLPFHKFVERVNGVDSSIGDERRTYRPKMIISPNVSQSPFHGQERPHNECQILGCETFNGNRSNEGLEIVRQSGKADGRETATAYADGYFGGVGEVLNERLYGFQTAVIETTAESKTTEETPTSPRLASKPATTRRKSAAK